MELIPPEECLFQVSAMLRNVRESRSLSYKEFADHLKIKVARVIEIEDSDRQVSLAEWLSFCAGFNLPIDCCFYRQADLSQPTIPDPIPLDSPSFMEPRTLLRYWNSFTSAVSK